MRINGIYVSQEVFSDDPGRFLRERRVDVRQVRADHNEATGCCKGQRGE